LQRSSILPYSVHHFNGYFSRYQNVSTLDFIGAKDDGGGGDNWSYDVQSSSQTVTTKKSTPSILQAV